MTAPDISILISTRDRPDDLLQTLRSLQVAVDRSPEVSVEVVIVENGSRPERRLDITSLQGTGHSRLRHVWMDQGNLSQARNYGMALAAGKLFVFIDDDCLADPDFIQDVIRIWRSSPPHFITGGRVKLANMLDLPLTIKDEPDPQLYTEDLHPGGFIHGCNFMMPRETAEMLGPFDARFGAGARFLAGEDTDYLIRAHASGVPLRYVPEMVVWHNHGRRDPTAIKKLFYGYSYANGALAAKHLRRHPGLVRHLYWALRLMLREWRGGATYDEKLGLNWASVAVPQLAGVRDYVAAVVSRRN